MKQPPECAPWLACLDKLLDHELSVRTWDAYSSELRHIRLTSCDPTRGASVVAKLFRRFPTLSQKREGVRLIARISDRLPNSFLREHLQLLRNLDAFQAKQSYGELLTLIAFLDEDHSWAREELNRELNAMSNPADFQEPIVVGFAFAAAHLWDESNTRSEASRVLCRIAPCSTERISQAISTVFWACDDFIADHATESLLRALAENPTSLSKVRITDLVEHLAGIVPHMREVIIDVSASAVRSARQESGLFEAGPTLVKIAMTLQRFNDTRDKALALLEDLLRLGLDDAFRVLREIDIRPSTTRTRMPPQRRRRRRV